eukprot:scaffold537_cov180-Ochromonas_danica.AAC.61
MEDVPNTPTNFAGVVDVDAVYATPPRSSQPNNLVCPPTPPGVEISARLVAQKGHANSTGLTLLVSMESGAIISTKAGGLHTSYITPPSSIARPFTHKMAHSISARRSSIDATNVSTNPTAIDKSNTTYVTPARPSQASQSVCRPPQLRGLADDPSPLRLRACSVNLSLMDDDDEPPMNT